MQKFEISPVGVVRNSRTEAIDDNWSSIQSEIMLNGNYPVECFDEIETFSHLEIIYYFNKSVKTVIGSEHPRENPLWPKAGIFAQRKKDRPNHLGATIVRLIKKEGRSLFVENLDAIDGTPVIDIKPIMKEYLPQGEIKQPGWSTELMKNYW